LLARRSQFHQNVLVTNVNPFNVQLTSLLQQWQQFFAAAGPPAPVASPDSPVNLLYVELQRQAAMQAIVDDFWLLGVISLVLMIGIVFLRQPRGGAERPDASMSHA
jgi:hypothetical protein